MTADAESKATAIPLAVEITVAGSADWWAGDVQLLHLVRSRLQELIDDFAVPLKLQISISKAFPEPECACPVTVSVDGRPCRKPVDTTRTLDTSDLTSLIDFIVWLVHTNRHLLWSQEILNGLCEFYTPEVITLAPSVLARSGSLKQAEEVIRAVGRVPADVGRGYLIELLVSRRCSNVVLEVGPRLFKRLADERGLFESAFESMRERLFYELGIKFPFVETRRVADLAEYGCRLRIGSVAEPIERIVREDELLVGGKPEFTNTLGVHGREARNPEDGSPATVVTGPQTIAFARNASVVTYWDSIQHVVLSVAGSFRRHAPVFLTAVAIERMLSHLTEAFPLPIVDLLERYSPLWICDVLRDLAEDAVSIRDLRSIIEAMLEAPEAPVSVPAGYVLLGSPVIPTASRGNATTPEGCADRVRHALSRQVTYQHSSSGQLTVIETTLDTEERLRQSLTQDWQGPYPGLTEAILKALRGHLPGAVLLTEADVRRGLRRAIRPEFSRLPVLCRSELDPAVPVVRLAWVKWG